MVLIVELINVSYIEATSNYKWILYNLSIKKIIVLLH